MRRVPPRRRGARRLLGCRGGLLLSNGGLEDGLHIARMMLSFERTRGLFQHSPVEMTYGMNAAVGRRYGAHRWGSDVLLMRRLGAECAVAAPKAVPGRPAPPPQPVAAAAAQLVLEFDIDTDGSVGPDLLMTRTGITLAGGRLRSYWFGAGE